MLKDKYQYSSKLDDMFAIPEVSSETAKGLIAPTKAKSETQPSWREEFGRGMSALFGSEDTLRQSLQGSKVRVDYDVQFNKSIQPYLDAVKQEEQNKQIGNAIRSAVTEDASDLAVEESPRPVARPGSETANTETTGGGLMTRPSSVPLDGDAETNLFSTIAGGESTDFNTVSGTSKIQPPKPITEMTVGEVRDWQDRSVDAGSESSAAGRFQIIRKTMDSLLDKGIISRDDVFDEDTQRRAYADLLERRGYSNFKDAIASASSEEERVNAAKKFQLGLAQEFASVPVPFAVKKGASGKWPKMDLQPGDSYYADPANPELNKPQHSVSDFMSRLLSFAQS